MNSVIYKVESPKYTCYFYEDGNIIFENLFDSFTVKCARFNDGIIDSSFDWSLRSFLRNILDNHDEDIYLNFVSSVLAYYTQFKKRGN